MNGAKLSIVGLLLYDPTLFDDMVLPVGVEKDVAVSAICSACYDLEILFPDPAFMKKQIAVWSKRKASYSWDKLYKTTQFVYNPIWNKDGTITETEDGNNSGTSQTIGAERGYNDSGLVDNTKAATDSGSETHITRTRKETGNIGVTSTQSMIKEEREISDFDIYEKITADFKKEFCLLIY